MADSRNLRAALRYAACKWAVLPIYGFKDKICVCGIDCETPGKHPRTRRGVKDATSDPKKIRAWWGEWPNANVAIATGRISGLLVLDVDLATGGYE
jgi:putative DNA primase/helicase